MNKIEAIRVDVEAPPALTGNLLPLLHELRHALEEYLQTGSDHSIDLNGIPMAPQEQQQLDTLLGEGEVHARLDALGRSEIRETGVPGVWHLTHYNTDEMIVGKFLEVTDCPAILKTQQPDIPFGIDHLDELIREHFPGSSG